MGISGSTLKPVLRNSGNSQRNRRKAVEKLRKKKIKLNLKKNGNEKFVEFNSIFN